MGAVGDDAAGLEDQDAVGDGDGAEAVGDDEGGAAAGEICQFFLTNRRTPCYFGTETEIP